jgi:hypothetical protein
MSFLKKLFEIGGEVVAHAQREQARKMGKPVHRSSSSSSGSSSSSSRPTEQLIGGKSIRQWESSWEHLGTLATASLSHLSDSVGLYRAKLNGRIVYIGRAVEYNNGGLRKRLSDYTRDSDSARKHQSGQKMHKHAHELQIEILITGDDAEAAQIAKKLEVYFVGKYQPEWNKKLL